MNMTFNVPSAIPRRFIGMERLKQANNAICVLSAEDSSHSEAGEKKCIRNRYVLNAEVSCMFTEERPQSYVSDVRIILNAGHFSKLQHRGGKINELLLS